MLINLRMMPYECTLIYDILATIMSGAGGGGGVRVRVRVILSVF